jgi:hypothetical protein
LPALLGQGAQVVGFPPRGGDVAAEGAVAPALSPRCQGGLQTRAESSRLEQEKADAILDGHAIGQGKSCAAP